MRLALHQTNDFSELLEVMALLRNEWIRLEEWDDHRLQITSTINGVREDLALRTLGSDTSTAEAVLDQLEDPQVVPVLIDLKNRRYQPSSPVSISDRRMWVHADTEATLSIDESGNVIRSQDAKRPSLLIIPTRRIFTAHSLVSLLVTSSTARYTGLPSK